MYEKNEKNKLLFDSWLIWSRDNLHNWIIVQYITSSTKILEVENLNLDKIYFIKKNEQLKSKLIYNQSIRSILPSY